ncbi:MAG: hypothetical protein M1839_009381 [Geoglossum umbratile]|nr:MAG: hypothetical protein M1839_009381 [Geoglossum umbratile]
MGKLTLLIVLTLLVASYLILGLGLKLGLKHDRPFSRDECYVGINESLTNKTLSPNSSIFYRDPVHGYLSSHPNIVLSLPGCIERCGGDVGFYPDVGPRLTTWLIPVLLLLSNIELPPLDKRRFQTVLHALGDPIDTLWSLLHKIESYCYCYDLVAKRFPDRCRHQKRLVATVLAGVEEIYGPDECLLDYLDTIAPQKERVWWWNEAACGLACARTDEFARTCLAMVLYIYGVIAAFVAKVGGEPTSPPGGRIGTALLLSWLVPVALLSNIIGSFTTHGTCYEVLQRMALRSNGKLELSVESYYDSQKFSAAIYSYRPNKRIPRAGIIRRIALPLVAAFPVLVSATGAFVIIWFTPPNGLNCRHVWVLGIFFLWLVSTFTTTATYELFVHDPLLHSGGGRAMHNYGKRVKHWYWILIKDSVIAFVSLNTIFLSSAGLFNTCTCWSGIFRFGREKARIPMNVVPIFKEYDEGIYPIVVGICLGLQVLFFILVTIKTGRGLRVMRWSETEKRRGLSETKKMQELSEMPTQHSTPLYEVCTQNNNWGSSLWAAMLRMK